MPGVSAVTETSTSLSIHSWSPPPAADQPGSAVKLDTNDDRVISAAWQNNSLWLAGNEACTPAGDAVARSCLRVIEVATNTSIVRQDITFGANGAYYFYPAIRPDGSGNLHVVFTNSSASAFASVSVTGRLATDPLNTLQASAQIRAGGGAQTDSSGRMGDYAGAAVDPSDPSMVWVIGEYIKSTASRNWGTFIAGLRFGMPDLVETAVSDPPATATVGGSFGVTDTVQNIGTGAAGASVTQYAISQSNTQAVNARLLTGSRAVPALAAGGTSTGTVTVTIPSGTAPGTYYLVACADLANAVPESNEANNCRASANTMVVSAAGAPDLVETAVSDPPVSATVGGSFTASDTVQNIGTGSAAASVTRYYLSTDTLRNAGDILLAGTRSVPALAAGASSPGTAAVTIPSGTAPATYFLLACADDTGLVAESNETNNCRASANTVVVSAASGTPDLVETSVSDPPATATVGSSFPVTDTVQNIGTGAAGASVTQYAISQSNTHGVNARLLTGSRAVPALAAGGTSTGTVTVTIPSGTAPGTYYLVACADLANAVPESNEANNCRASAGQVTVGP